MKFFWGKKQCTKQCFTPCTVPKLRLKMSRATFFGQEKENNLNEQRFHNHELISNFIQSEGQDLH